MILDRFRKPKPRSNIPIVINRKGTMLRLDDCYAAHLRSGARWSRRRGKRAETASTRKGGGEERYARAHRHYEIARFLDELADELGKRRVSDLRRGRLRDVHEIAKRLRGETA